MTIAISRMCKTTRDTTTLVTANIGYTNPRDRGRRNTSNRHGVSHHIVVSNITRTNNSMTNRYIVIIENRRRMINLESQRVNREHTHIMY